MSDAPLQETPLSQFISEDRTYSLTQEAGILFTERSFLGYVNLRCDPSELRILDAVGNVLGVDLPLQTNTGSTSSEMTVLWLGPNEWLLVTSPNRETALVQNLSNALRDMFVSVTDITGGQTMVNLRGANVLNLIAKGCSLDIHPRVFGPGRCAQVLLAKAPVVIWRPGDTQSYDLIVRRTYADYLVRWIEDAAQEYGLRVLPRSKG